MHISTHPARNAQRGIFDADYGSYAGLPMDPRTDDDADSFTSMQPLGDAGVEVVYSFDSNTDLSIDGATIGGEFVNIDNFSSFVRGQWRKAIEAEERKSAEIEGWGE